MCQGDSPPQTRAPLKLHSEFLRDHKQNSTDRRSLFSIRADRVSTNIPTSMGSLTSPWRADHPLGSFSKKLVDHPLHPL